MQKGFTLIELIIACVIISILGSISATYMRGLYLNFQVFSEINRLHSFISQSRELAVIHQQHIAICPTDDFLNCNGDWTKSLMQFIDSNNSKHREENETLLNTIVPYDITDRIIQYNKSQIRFNDQGMANGYLGTLAYCYYGGSEGIIVSRVGRIRFALDFDGDGISEKSDRTPIACN